MSPVSSILSFNQIESVAGGIPPHVSASLTQSNSFQQFEQELVQLLKQVRTNPTFQWEDWSSFNTWFEGLSRVYEQGLRYQEVGLEGTAAFQFKQLGFFYQQFLFYQSCQEMIPTLERFVQYFQTPRRLNWNELQTYRNTYQSIVEILQCLSHHWVKKFEFLAQSFLRFYHQLPTCLDWATFEQTVSTLSQPSGYLSKHDLKAYDEHVQEVLAKGRELVAYMPPVLKAKCKQLKDQLAYLQAHREAYNQDYLHYLLQRHDASLSNIDGKSLDEQQRVAVLSEEDQTVVLAGAGSGKTLTIAAKVQYLVKEVGVDPSEILLISFTNQASEEMKHRIQKALNLPVDVKTFHKLGLDIISRASAKKPSVASDKRLTQLIESYLLEELFVSPDWSRLLVQHFPRYLGLEDKGFSHATLREHYEFRLLQKLKQFSLDSFDDIESLALKLSDGKRTLQHEYVKSMEEMKIANFLFLNGIRYEYESDYPYNTADENHRQYKPDFFLPDYKIYLEHFGVSERGTASWLPKEKATDYEEGIEWKRSIHQQYQTKMIETYSYQEKNQMLLKSLKSQLEQEGVPFQHVDVFTLLKRLMSVEKSEFTHLVHLIETFISFFKGNLYTLKTLEEWKSEHLDPRTDCFYQMVYPIMERYEALLCQHDEVDFNDMIAQSIKIATSCEASFLGYRYVIVDEYQDISYARYELIRAICEKCQAKLFCVGDDWQSIYRFAGSDLALFHQTAHDAQVLRLEQTYRNSQALIDIAGSFIMKNPSQYQKSLVSKGTQHELLPIQLYQYGRAGQLIALKEALRDIARSYGEKERVFLLGRYARDLQCLDESFDVVEEAGGYRLVFNEYPELQLQFLTVHKSKGMECDHVILLNLKDAKMGFPSQLQDDPILSRLLVKEESYPFAEERRLFYVALTRAKKTCRLLVPIKNPSCFVKELVTDYQVPTVWRQPYQANPSFQVLPKKPMP